MLGDIRIRQELYYQANSRYACSDGATTSCGCTRFFPTAPDPTDPSENLPVEVPNQACAATDETDFPRAAWCRLGLDPNGSFYFKYAFVGWDGQTAGAAASCDGVPVCGGPGDTDCFALDPNKPWWYAVAHANMDRDPHVTVSTFYISSSLKQVISFNEGD